MELRCEEAAKYLGINLKTLYVYIHKGIIHSRKEKNRRGGKGNLTFIDINELNNYKNKKYGEKNTTVMRKVKKVIPTLETTLSRMVGKYYIYKLNYVKVIGYQVVGDSIKICTDKGEYLINGQHTKNELKNFLLAER